MYLEIDVSEEWTTSVVDDGHLHQLGDTSIHALRIRELPEDAGHWMQRAALRGAPAGATWTTLARAELQTVDGWDALLVETLVEHEAFRRVRVVALYRFLDYAAGAILDIAESWYEPQRADLLELLGSARPAWGPQERVGLAKLLGGAHRHLVTLA
jgi:hypothetical protein